MSQPLVKYEPFGAEVPLSEPSWCACFTFLSRVVIFVRLIISSIGGILTYFCVYARRESIRAFLPNWFRYANTSSRVYITHRSVVRKSRSFSLSLSLSPFVRNKTALFDSYDLRWHHVLLSSPLLLTTSKNNLMTQNNRPKLALAVLQPIARWMALQNTLVFRERGGTNRGRLGQTSGIEQPREV